MNYSDVARKAKNAIMKNGSPCTIRREGEEVYNAQANIYEATEYEINGFALQEAYSAQLIDGSVIKMGDVKLLCVFGSEPKENDTVVFGDNAFTVVSVQAVKPNGFVPIYYILQVRC